MRALVVGVGIALALRAEAAPKQHDPGGIVLVIDHSGSMRGSRLDGVKDAARVMVDALDPTDVMSVIAFDSDVSVVVPLQKVGDGKQIVAAIKKVEAGGGTNVYPALKAAQESLHGSKLKHKHVVLVTDGESPLDGIADLVSEMRVEGITISTVGLQGADRNFLMMIADGGDGRLFMIEDTKAFGRLFAHDVRSALGR